MSHPNLHPLSPTHAAALVRVAELRADAERHRLVRAVQRRRRVPAWPVAVATALRESLSSSDRPARHARSIDRPACATC